MPDSPPALRPPEKWRHLKWHWVVAGKGEPFPISFHHPEDFWDDGLRRMSPHQAFSIGYRYNAPCDPAALVPDPDDERQTETVTRQLFVSSREQTWDETKEHMPSTVKKARQILTALRDLK